MNATFKKSVVVTVMVGLASLALALNNASLFNAIDEGASSHAMTTYTPSSYGPSAGQASQVSMGAGKASTAYKPSKYSASAGNASQVSLDLQAAREQQLLKTLAALGVLVG